MVRILLVILVLSGLAACRSITVAGECPETRSQRCMTKKVCTEDKKRGCQVCTCESGWESDPVRQEDRMRGRIPE